MVILRNCSLDEFDEIIKDKKIICFCGGMKFEEFLQMFPVASQIVCLVDNFAKSTKYSYEGIEIPIINIRDLSVKMKDCILLITSLKNGQAILKQLDAISFLDGKDCYCLGLFTPQKKEPDLVKNEKPVIPKKIHYFWVGGKELPEVYKRNVKSWKECCPDYEIVLWNENNYDFSKIPYMEQAYKAKKWGFVPDYARLDVLNTYGGFYLDTDVKLLKSLDELRYFDFVCGFEGNNNNKINFGQGFGNKADCPLLKDMMKVYESERFIYEDGSLNTTASSKYQTPVLEKYGVKLNKRIQQTRGITVFSSEYFAPISIYGYGQYTSKSISDHQHAATWHNEKQHAERVMYRKQYEYLCKRLANEG